MADAPTTLQRSTESGRVELLCPRCETWQDVLSFKTPQVSVKYAKSLNSIMKCGRCRHVFSPRFLNED